MYQFCDFLQKGNENFYIFDHIPKSILGKKVYNTSFPVEI